MTPDEAVQSLVSILRDCDTNSFTEESIYDMLKGEGFSDEIANRTYKLTQVACGRKFLEGMGIDFSNEFMWFNRSGEVEEIGQLTKEPYYLAALKYAGPDSIGAERFGNFALMSADVQAVNNALNSGSNPSDLVTAPVCMFLEPPTQSGLESAQLAIESHLRKVSKQSSQQKPWWRFW